MNTQVFNAAKASYASGDYASALQLLTQCLELVCRERVTIGMYPMCALNLVIPPASVNVNVHPNKLEVRFKDEIAMRTACERLLATAFEGEHVLQLGAERPVQKPIERVATIREVVPPAAEAPSEPPKPVQTAQKLPFEPAKPAAEAERPQPMEAPKNTVKPAAPVKPFKAEKPVQMDVFQRVMRQELDKLGNASGSALREDRLSDISVESPKATEVSIESKPTSVDNVSEKPVYRVIGVVLKTYILIEADDSLVLIDQHAAHERLNYEKFMAQLEAGRGSQQLLTPLVLRLTAREMALIQENMDVLRDSGYDVEPFGELDIQVRAVPFILGRAELRPAFMDTINALYRLRNATVDLRRAEVAQMSCKAAVKGGDPLSEGEIESLIRQLLTTGAPPTCPHGRPVMKVISRRELEKMFKRIQ